jgi:multicomponent Na+:H+ antiporter subunit E
MTALRHIPGRVLALLGLAAWAVGAVVTASAQVARDILAPRPRLHSVVLVLDLRTRTPVETATVAGLITLTPGTLSLSVRDAAAAGEPPTLWVHGLYGADPEALRADLDALQTRVIRALRHPGAVADVNPGARTTR